MPEARTVLAFDFGIKRIGVAVGEAELGTAHPLPGIAAPGFAAIERLVKELGHPVTGTATTHDEAVDAVATCCPATTASRSNASPPAPWSRSDDPLEFRGPDDQ